MVISDLCRLCLMQFSVSFANFYVKKCGKPRIFMCLGLVFDFVDGYYLNIYLIFFRKKCGKPRRNSVSTMVRLWRRLRPCAEGPKDQRTDENKNFRKLHSQAVAR
ncbi:hypothetical protein DsansV1_C03g0028991 [Dioscorea sansibarensis]